LTILGNPIDMPYDDLYICVMDCMFGYNFLPPYEYRACESPCSGSLPEEACIYSRRSEEDDGWLCVPYGENKWNCEYYYDYFDNTCLY